MGWPAFRCASPFANERPQPRTCLKGKGAGAVPAPLRQLRHGNGPDLEAGALGSGPCGLPDGEASLAVVQGCRRRELGATGRRVCPTSRSCSVACENVDKRWITAARYKRIGPGSAEIQGRTLTKSRICRGFSHTQLNNRHPRNSFRCPSRAVTGRAAGAFGLRAFCYGKGDGGGAATVMPAACSPVFRAVFTSFAPSCLPDADIKDFRPPCPGDCLNREKWAARLASNAGGPANHFQLPCPRRNRSDDGRCPAGAGELLPI
jgi:hypothetical protein